MQAYRIKKKVSSHGKIQLDALPFAEGEVVEIIVLASPQDEAENLAEPLHTLPHSLKGSVLKYVDPTEPVAQDEWIATQ